MKFHCLPAVVVVTQLLGFGASAQDAAIRDTVRSRVHAEYPGLFELYKHFHANPELSLHEAKTSARLAEELKATAYDVTLRVGNYGVVAVLKNGTGPTILVRADMDALLVKEQTGLSFASKVTTKDDAGNEVPVMHACGHDMHMTALVGVARVLAQMKDRWQGTLVLIGQPAEERGGGASMMLKDGLFTRFPRPDFCLALHDNAELAAGTLGYTPGFAMANVDSVDLTVRGLGGHGAHPDKTKDPVVLAAQIVLALQTIVSRERDPLEPAVVTVGSIHGGTKHNIIPDEVKLQLTVRSYTDEVRTQTLAAIQRIARGQAITAAIPDDRLPVVHIEPDFTAATYNDPKLTERLAGVFNAWSSATNVIQRKPSMGGEDFGDYGRTEHKIPICMFEVGGVNSENLKDNLRTGKPLPSLHSPLWAPGPEPTIKTGITAMTAAVLELMEKK
jgi:amidohydrolase